MILQGVSLVCGVLSAISGYRAVRYMTAAVRCHAKVTKLVKVTDGFKPLFRPVFSFKDESGKKHTVSSSIASYPAPFVVGETIEILYPPGKPSLAEYRSHFALWGLTVFLVAFATITFLLAHVFQKQMASVCGFY
jgi:hypothetical protein